MATLAQRFDIPVFEQFSTGDLMYQDQSGAVQRGRGYASMEGSFRLAGGIGSVIDALAQTLAPSDVLTSTRLTSVDHSSAEITAQLDQNGTSITVQARQIILATPPRVIADTVSFEPALDGAQMAPPKHMVLQDWATIPEIAREQDRQPVREHPSYGLPHNLRDLSTRGLHFGSTETAPEFGGFLEGALEAAERVVDRLTVLETYIT